MSNIFGHLDQAQNVDKTQLTDFIEKLKNPKYKKTQSEIDREADKDDEDEDDEIGELLKALKLEMAEIKGMEKEVKKDFSPYMDDIDLKSDNENPKEKKYLKGQDLYDVY
jgi:hypothetical protein